MIRIFWDTPDGTERQYARKDISLCLTSLLHTSKYSPAALRRMGWFIGNLRLHGLGLPDHEQVWTQLIGSLLPPPTNTPVVAKPQQYQPQLSAAMAAAAAAVSAGKSKARRSSSKSNNSHARDDGDYVPSSSAHGPQDNSAHSIGLMYSDEAAQYGHSANSGLPGLAGVGTGHMAPAQQLLAFLNAANHQEEPSWAYPADVFGGDGADEFDLLSNLGSFMGGGVAAPPNAASLGFVGGFDPRGINSADNNNSFFTEASNAFSYVTSIYPDRSNATHHQHDLFGNSSAADAAAALAAVAAAPSSSSGAVPPFWQYSPATPGHVQTPGNSNKFSQ